MSFTNQSIPRAANKGVLKQLLAILLLCGLFVAVYWSSVAPMIELWSSSAHRHAKLVPLISVFFLWHERDRLQEARWRGSLAGLLVLAMLVWAWSVARSGALQLVEHVLVVAMLNAFLLTCAGAHAYRRFVFPLVLLFFCVPAGQTLVPYLMETTADIAAVGLSLLNVPAYREGVFLTLPNGSFEVAEVCSGIRYLNAGLLIGVLTAHLTYTSLVRKAIFVPALIVLFVLVNGIRAALVMAIANASDMTLMVGEDHIFFGWVLFLGATLLMYAVAVRTSDRDVEKRV